MNLPKFIVESASRDFSREVWVLDPPTGSPQHIAVFLDGEFYVDRMNAPATIYDMQRCGDIPPLACAFVSHVDGAARHRDLTCSADYADFIASDLMDWMLQRNPGVSATDHFIGGASLGGLAAAFISLSNPQIFSRCLSHSGSFWWNDEWLTSQLENLPSSRVRFWSSVGDQETEAGVSHQPSGMRQEVAQIAACKRFAQALENMQILIHHRVYQGGHEFEPWQKELPDALRWLLSHETDSG